MTFVKRLRLPVALLTSAAAAAVVGSAVFGDSPTKPVAARALDPVQAATTAARTKYTRQPTVAYARPDGTTAFAWQLRPTLPPAAPRPRDVLVMIDTSASQAGLALDQARAVLNAVRRPTPGRPTGWTCGPSTSPPTRPPGA